MAKQARYTEISDPIQMAIARLAEAVRQDVYDNGSRHSRLLREFPKNDQVDPNDIVSDGYTGGGVHSRQFGAWSCSFCGMVYAGIDAAVECCNR